MLEKQIEAKLRDRVEYLGGRAIKLPANLYHGIPDRLVLMPGGFAQFVEVKRPGETVMRPTQVAWREWLESNGYTYREIDSMDFTFLGQ